MSMPWLVLQLQTFNSFLFQADFTTRHAGSTWPFSGRTQSFWHRHQPWTDYQWCGNRVKHQKFSQSAQDFWMSRVTSFRRTMSYYGIYDKNSTNIQKSCQSQSGVHRAAKWWVRTLYLVGDVHHKAKCLSYTWPLLNMSILQENGISLAAKEYIGPTWWLWFSVNSATSLHPAHHVLQPWFAEVFVVLQNWHIQYIINLSQSSE